MIKTSNEKLEALTILSKFKTEEFDWHREILETEIDEFFSEHGCKGCVHSPEIVEGFCYTCNTYLQ